jgi:hypothetical protein
VVDGPQNEALQQTRSAFTPTGAALAAYPRCSTDSGSATGLVSPVIRFASSGRRRRLGAMLSYSEGRLPSAEAPLGEAWLGPHHLCVCRPAEPGDTWSNADLTDQPCPTRAASLGPLSTRSCS